MAKCWNFAQSGHTDHVWLSLDSNGQALTTDIDTNSIDFNSNFTRWYLTQLRKIANLKLLLWGSSDQMNFLRRQPASELCDRRSRFGDRFQNLPKFVRQISLRSSLQIQMASPNVEMENKKLQMMSHKCTVKLRTNSGFSCSYFSTTNYFNIWQDAIVTRWVHYFSLFGHLHHWKFAQ